MTRPVRLLQVTVSAVEVRELLDEQWRRAEDRRAQRERGGYNAGHRCWSCHRFVSGPNASCAHCGQQHGGMNHEAYATR